MKKLSKEQLRGMSPLRRGLYLAGYYFWPTLLAAFILAALGTAVWEDYFADQPVMSIEMIDSEKTTPDGDAFDAFLQEEGYPCDCRWVDVSKVIQLGNEEGDLPINPKPMLICKHHSGKTDVYFWDSDEVGYMLGNMALMDLREVLPFETLVKYQDQLIFTGPVLDGGYPCGIYLEDNTWVRENEYYEQCMVGISENTENPELAAAFLRHIL